MITAEKRAKTIIREYPKNTYADYYVTVKPEIDGSVAEVVQSLYGELLSVLKDKNIQVIQEKIHGNAKALEAFKDARELAFAAAGMASDCPYTYVEGRSLGSQEITSVQVWGIQSLDGSTRVRDDADAVTPARVFEGEGFELVYIPRIHGFDESKPEDKGSVTEQCQLVFDRTRDALARFGMSFEEVPRTWIYCRRLLDWYGELNRIRTQLFHEVGIYSTGKEPVFPASTGIQGRFSDEEIFLDVLAVNTEGDEAFKMEPIVTTSRQYQAYGYGSAFSRGMVVKHEGYRTVYVSGTASINVLGDSTYVGDTEMQTLDTLMNIAALLEDQGGSLGDICTGVVYCKNRKAYEAFLSTMRMLRIPSMPLVCVEADVCRHELLIEIEAVAVIKE